MWLVHVPDTMGETTIPLENLTTPSLVAMPIQHEAYSAWLFLHWTRAGTVLVTASVSHPALSLTNSKVHKHFNACVWAVHRRHNEPGNSRRIAKCTVHLLHREILKSGCCRGTVCSLCPSLMAGWSSGGHLDKKTGDHQEEKVFWKGTGTLYSCSGGGFFEVHCV